MSRPPRDDAPGAFHHVWNRGIARRTMFEYQRDTRRFLAELARQVHRRVVRVHAYTLMSNHFHLLLESVDGRLSDCMRQVQGIHTRCFNPPRDREGTLVQGRFRSRRVESLSDRLTLICYIDRNPVEARLSRHGAFYPHGSAAHYARRAGPPWLERSWVESVVRESRHLQVYDPAAYPAVFRAGMREDQVEWMERRIRAGNRGPDRLDHVIQRASAGTRGLMSERASLADGTDAGIPIVAASSVRKVLAGGPADGSDGPGAALRSGRILDLALHVGLLRDLAAETFRAIGVRLGISKSRAMYAYEEYRGRMLASPAYADQAAELGHQAVLLCHGWLLPLLAR
jgi:REP element-mobilizing transposase RayT